jgi:DNA repair photolyase
MPKKKVDVVRMHECSLKTGITRSKEFEKKTLAEFAANVGTKCGHDCTYCSSGAMLRMHPSFKEIGENPFGFGYAIVDPKMPGKVAKDAAGKRHRGKVMLCTTVDAWCPAAQQHGLGRKCLEAIMAEPDWSVRILTKNAAVAKDFDLIKKYRDRVQVSLSLTATPEMAGAMAIIEPNASPILERMAALEEAKRLGLRTYAMLCPLLPGVANTPKQLRKLVGFAKKIGAEEVFAEPVNARGSGLMNTEKALRSAGYENAADAVCSVRTRRNWSQYVVELIADLQHAMRKRGMIDKLRFLLYSSGLTEQDKAIIRKDDEGVIWLGEKPAS